MSDKVVAGYEIEDTLGEGGMGIVYRARDATLGRPVALKLIRSEGLSAQAKERFLREARACSAINHPNIVTVYAAGEDNGRPYLAMEFLEGRTMREIIDEGAVPWEQALRWAIDLLDALNRVHGEGIIHRDLKPENIFVTSDGRIKLMDFGIAHVSSSQTITKEGASLGTAHYMSPEQAAGKRTSTKSDLFSMAAVIYEMLTGRRPFDGEHPMAVLYSITNAPPEPLSEQSAELPTELEAVLSRAFEKDPAERYADAAEFRAALQEVLGEEEPKPPARRFILLSATIAVSAIIAAVAILIATSDRDKPNRELARQHNELGVEFEAQGDLNRARMEYRQATIADPTFARPWNNLGFIEMSEGNLVEADSLFRRAVAADSTYTTAVFNLARVRWDLGDVEGAEKQYRASIDADSTFFRGYSDLGALLLVHGRGEEAARVVDVGLTKDPANPFLLKKKAQIEYELGQRQQARLSLASALEEATRRSKSKALAEEMDSTVGELGELVAEIQTLFRQWQEE